MFACIAVQVHLQGVVNEWTFPKIGLISNHTFKINLHPLFCRALANLLSHTKTNLSIKRQ